MRYIPSLPPLIPYIKTYILGIVIFATGLGAIPLGSSTAFIDLTGSFIILTTVSYAIPIVANMLTGQKYLPKGPFQLGRGVTSQFVGWGAVVLIMFFNVFYCFRKYFPQPYVFLISG